MKICVLDEPSNFLDREALGGLAVAIKEWTGAVVSMNSISLGQILLASLVSGYHFAQQ